MPNEITFQEGLQTIDEHLRPIKVGGDVSSLEISQSGSGARVTGDLIVTGNIKGKTDFILFDDLTCDDLACDNLIASGNIACKGSTFTMFSIEDEDDYFAIEVDEFAATTITTHDQGSNEADLTFEVDGKLTFDVVEEVVVNRAFVANDAGTYTALDIDYEKIEASTSNNTMIGIKIAADNNDATNGTNYMYGIYSVATLTHAADAGTSTTIGASFSAVGNNAGSTHTSASYGLKAIATGSDTNVGIQTLCGDGGLDLKLLSSANQSDYCAIAVTAEGATTMSTVDSDGNSGADLIFNIDGYVDINSASGEDILFDSGGDIKLMPDGDAIIDKDTAITATGTAKGLHIDYDHTGISASGQEITGIGLDIDMNCESVTHVGTVNQTGIDIDIVSADDGTQVNTGLDISCSGGDKAFGIMIDTTAETTASNGMYLDNKNGGTDFKNVSSADVTDYFSINTIAAGATTLKTNDNTVGATGHLTLSVDGNIVLGCNTGGAITLQENDASAYTPSAASDATTKAYVDTADYTQYHFIKCGFNNGGTAKLYIPLAAGEDTREVTSPINASERVVMICPFDGSVETIWARSEEACGSTVMGMHIGTTDAEVPALVAQQTVTVDMSTDDTSYEFDFVSAGTNTFSQGAIMMFSVDPTTAMNDTHFMIVLKFDVST